MNAKIDPVYMSKYSPKSMIQNSIRGSDGTLYYDRNKCVLTQDDQQAFYYIMSVRYKMPWKSVESLTVYFDMDGDDIIGGCYNIDTQLRVSERVLVSSSKKAPYTYTEPVIDELKTMIKNA